MQKGCASQELMADFQIITTKDTTLHEGKPREQNLESKTFVVLRDLRGDDFYDCRRRVWTMITPQSRSAQRL
jgi:hypothetical protein